MKKIVRGLFVVLYLFTALATVWGMFHMNYLLHGGEKTDTIWHFILFVLGFLGWIATFAYAGFVLAKLHDWAFEKK